MSLSYYTPDTSTEVNYEVKKSRFIARLCPALDREQAMQALHLARHDYPDARHHCWAYRIGPPANPTLQAMSDDGEPNGTAGKPILNVMQHKPVGDAMVIVVRYFGGIKLGASGLVRAYSSATQLCYDSAKLRFRQARESCLLTCKFADEQGLRMRLQQYDVEIVETHYTEHVTLHLKIDEVHLAALRQFVNAFSDARLHVGPN